MKGDFCKMRNKKYRPFYAMLGLFIFFLFCLAATIFFIKFTKILGIIAGIVGILFSATILIAHIFSYVMILDDKIIIRQPIETFYSKKVSLFNKTIVPINEVFMIEFDDTSIYLMLKDGNRFTFKSGAHPKRKELVKLFEEIRQEVIEKTKQEEKTN